MLIDPVCGMHVDPESAPESFTYREHTFYFCSEHCRKEFEANPDRYIDRARELNPEGYGDCEKAA